MLQLTKKKDLVVLTLANTNSSKNVEQQIQSGISAVNDK